MFRSMEQLKAETVDQYVTRLKGKAESCEFGAPENIEEQIRDQVIEKCSSSHLRRQLLERGRNLS